MQLFAILQVIISITFIYLVLSILASEAQETISTLLEFRSRNLHRSIAILFNECEDSQNQEFTKLIYQTQIVKSLNQYINSNIAWQETKLLSWLFKKKISFGPSYIEKEAFVDAVFEVIQNQLENNNQFAHNTTIGKSSESKDEQENNKNTDTDNIIAKLNSILAKDKNSGLKNAIQRLIQIAKCVELKKGAKAELNDLRAELEKIFEQSQDRASGVYKRNIKGVLFAVGLALSIGLNVDFFYMVNTLSQNPTLAADLSGVATNVWQSNENNFTSYQQCLEAQDNSNNQCQENFANFQNGIKSTIKSQLNSQPLQVNTIGINDIIFWDGKALDDKPEDIFSKIVGIFLSAVAIAMGAPFWFDVLGKFVNVRNTGQAIQAKIPSPPKES